MFFLERWIAQADVDLLQEHASQSGCEMYVIPRERTSSAWPNRRENVRDKHRIKACRTGCKSIESNFLLKRFRQSEQQ